MVSEDHDTILFGSTSFDVFHEFANLIDTSLNEGVSDLPLLSAESKVKLIELLHKAYYRNVDIAEVYAQRNIFSIGSLPPSRRAKLVEAFLKDEIPSFTAANTTETTKEQTTSSTYRYPERSEIPSAGELQQCKDEVRELQERLRETQRRRNSLVRKLECLSKVDQETKITSRVLQDASNANLQDTVDNMVTAKVQLDNLCQQGRDLADNLDAHKRNRADIDQDVVPAPQPRKKLSTREAFAEHQSLINTSMGDLSRLKELVKRKDC